MPSDLELIEKGLVWERGRWALNTAWSFLAEQPSTLHHFTPANRVTSILGEKRFRAGSLRRMNDNHELDYAYGVIHDVKESIMSNFGPLTRRVITKALELTPKWDDGLQAFATCFSNAPDLPHQWARYADAGRGYRLDFDYNAVEARVARFTAHSPFPASLWPVMYDRPKQERLIRESLGLFGQISDQFQAPPDSAEEWALVNQVRTRISLIAGRMKDKKWAIEREWRIFATAAGDHLSLVGHHGKPPRPFMPLALPAWTEMLAGLTPGHNCDGQLDGAEVTAWLEGHGYQLPNRSAS